MSVEEDEGDDEFQDWWQHPKVQQEIRSVQSLTGGSMAEACIVVMLAQVAGAIDRLEVD
jgi:hypothetical protein